MKQKSAITLLYLLLSILCYGQKGKLFTVDSELSSSMINSIYQDKEGIIWIATEDGLNRYDGAKFSVYKHNAYDEHSLLNNYVRILFEDTKGAFLIGTLNGLQAYDRATGIFSTIPMTFEDGGTLGANISTIIERSNGEVLIGTSGHGIFSLSMKEGHIKAQQLPTLVPSYLINQLYEDRKGTLWVITNDKGIYSIDKNKKLKHYPNEKEMIWPSSICEDKAGNIYIGCLKNGLFKYNPQTDCFTHIKCPSYPQLPIKALYSMNQDEIYIGTDGNGMKVYQVQKEQIMESPINVTSFNFNKSKVHSILKDKQGNLWLGFFQKGVMIVPPITNNFKYMGYKSSTHNTIGSCCIMSVYKDHNDSYWIGTDNDGIYCIAPDGKQKAHFEQSPDIGHSVSSTIMSICEDSDRNIWIGSYRDGLAKLNPQTGHCEYVTLPYKNEEQVQSIYSIIEDNHRQLWVSAMGAGLYRINLDTKDVFRCPTPKSGLEYRLKGNMLHNSWINCLLYSCNDKLYIGTYDGLGCLDIPTMSFVSTYKVNRLLQGDVIYALYEDLHQNIWIGTSQGLKQLNHQTQEVKQYTISDGLPSNSISAIEGDLDGNLWISTNLGISRFNPEAQTFVNFYASDGLQGNEFSKGVSFAGKKGEIIFGGTNGITYFNPKEITSPNKKPEIRITDFYIHDKAVKLGMKSGHYDIIKTSVMNADKFHLSYKDNSFSIEFSAMEFYSPERISYSYIFNNNTWVNLQPGVNRVSFSDLTPGTYHFQVRARDYNSYSEIKQLTIIVSPPWYVSLWAKTIYCLTAIIIVAFIIVQIRQRYHARQRMLEHIHAEQLNEAKLQFFINISHEIRTPMSLIISPLQKLMANDSDTERQQSYNIIYRNAERLLRLVNQLMDIRKIDKGQMQLKFQETDMVSFIQDLYDTFTYQANTKHILLTFHSEVKELKAWIDPKNFDKVVLNILSNAFKFTPENGKIKVHLCTGNNPNTAQKALSHYFEISIEDDGIGINETELERIFDRFYQIRNSQNNSNIGTGIGLHLTRSLVELHHGSITVENNKETSGCRFIIRLPLGKAHLTPEEIDNSVPQNSPVHITTALPAAPITETSQKIRSKSKYRVLVVEDDEEIRRYICRELGSDFHMQECNNGKEALTQILKKSPDLVISDIMMPEMDGITLCSKIKQNININHIPVILLTAKSREEDNLEGLSIGADAYITKPFSIEILRQSAFNLIKSRERLRNNFQGSQEQEERMQKLEMDSPDDRLLNRIMKVINDNIANPKLNVELVADTVGISRVHLHRKLKELTNQSTRDLIRNIRLKQAASLLASKRQNINEVASLTGFTNVAYFSTAFKELYGMTPTAYMEQHLNSTSSDTE